ncbi:Dipeptide transport system permease protein DppC [subsurface metagenome]
MAVEITQGRRIWSTFIKNKTALAGGVIACIIILIAFLAPWISPYDPLIQDPYIRLTGPSRIHLLGTDDFGRDVLSRIIWGGRVSLIIGSLF